MKPLIMWITTNCGKFLTWLECQTTLTVSWETCMQAKKQQWEPHMEQWTGSNFGKENVKAVYCHPAYLTSLQSTSCKIAMLDESQAGIKIVGRNINNLRYADDTTLMAENEEELKSFLMRGKEESEKAGLKLSIQKTKNTASGLITSWQTEEEKVEAVTAFIFFSSKITVDGDCSHEIKRRLLLGRQAMTNLDSILKKKQRHHFTKKGLYSQSYSFSNSHVWMWQLDHREGWAPKTWCFWTVVLDETPGVPCTIRSSNQTILNKINPQYSLEGLMLKLQYFGHLMQRDNSL